MVSGDSVQVKKRSSEEGSTQWTTGIAEVQLPIEYGLWPLHKILHPSELCNIYMFCLQRGSN